ncbi:putative secologanin synthase [Dioscorea sansibarensis]
MMMVMMMMLWAVVVAVVFVWVWRTLDWVRLTPKRIECEFRRQGLRGNHYRILYGDAKDNDRLSKDVRSRPLPLHCHDIAPRVLPLLHKAIKDHGTHSLFTNSLYCVCFMS